jgi:hypothetical protein
MTDRWWVAFLVYPAPLYAGLLVLVQFGTGGVLFPLGFVLAFAFGSATGFGLVREPIIVWGGRAFFFLVAFMPPLIGGSAGASALDLSAGVALGIPFLWLEYAWRETASPGARIVSLEAALAVGVVALATLTTTAAPLGSSVGERFWPVVGQVLINQDAGIAAILLGGTATSMPLETAFDPVFVGLGGLALAAVLASWFSPRTALGDALPWSFVRLRRTTATDAPAEAGAGLRPGQREVLASRTLPLPPEGVIAEGFGPLLLASVLVLVFVALAVAEPTLALLPLAVGVLGAVIAVGFVLSRRLRPLGGLGA